MIGRALSQNSRDPDYNHIEIAYLRTMRYILVILSKIRAYIKTIIPSSALESSMLWVGEEAVFEFTKTTNFSNILLINDLSRSVWKTDTSTKEECVWEWWNQSPNCIMTASELAGRKEFLSISHVEVASMIKAAVRRITEGKVWGRLMPCNV